MRFFAYGTLASGGLMAEKCPDAEFVSRAVLKDHRMKGLNILAEEGSSVDGVLWNVDEGCLETLDEYENCPDSYQRKTVKVYSEETGGVEAIAYYIPVEK